MEKKWVLQKPIDYNWQKKFPEIPNLILQLLYNRGLKSQAQIDEFLNPDYGQDILDPFLFPDMEKAVNRIYKAVVNNEKIAIHGDYDADGVCSSVLLSKVFQQLKADFIVYIPHREKEGYGLNKKTIEYLAKKKINLIITVDCAISNYQEIELANDKGIDVIVTDHHAEPLKLPPAYAIINPKVKKCNYPFYDLAGVGVAFKLAQAIVACDKNKIFPEGFEKWLLDLVAIGTVADVMPLLGENRTLVKYGLIVLNKTRNMGLKTLADKAGILPVTEQDLINSENVGFVIAPRINAAGRMDHANVAYELFMVNQYSEAKELTDKLEKNNKDRQKLTEKLTAEIKKQIAKSKQQYMLIAEGKKWPLGVMGIVAGRIKDEMHRPVIIISKLGKKIVGSGRSIDELNLIATLDKVSDYFEVYGGHAGAAGFTLAVKKNITGFKKELNKIVEQELKDKDLRPKINIEGELSLQDLNWELYDQIEKFEPFGTANPKPVFLVKDLIVDSVRTVGHDNNHLKLYVKHDKMVKNFEAIGFGMGKKIEEINYGTKVEVVCEINLNEFNGTRKLELRLIDIKKQ